MYNVDIYFNIYLLTKIERFVSILNCYCLQSEICLVVKSEFHWIYYIIFLYY